MAMLCKLIARVVLHRLIILLILISLPGMTVQLSSNNLGSIQPGNFQAPTIDSETLLPNSVQKALEIVRNVESMPSCAKIASSALLHSCSTLEGSVSNDDTDVNKRGSDLFIDQEAGIYSVRLAVCELNDAEFQIPQACNSFVPTQQTSKRRGIRAYWRKKGPSEPTVSFDAYDEVTLSNLKQCRQALSSSSVAWTSYSNNRQNAAVICRAMQSEIAKDDQLEIGKILAKTAMATAASLEEALEQIQVLTTSYRELSNAIPQFQLDLAEGNQKQLEQVQQFWADVERVRANFLDITSGVSSIRDEVQAANYDVIGLRSVIINAVEVATTDMQSAIGTVASGVNIVSDNLVDLQQVLVFVKEKFEQELVQGLHDASHDLLVVNTLTPQLLDVLSGEINTTAQRIEDNLRKERQLMKLNQENRRIVIGITEGLQELNATTTSLALPLLLAWPGAHEFLHELTAFMARTGVYTLLGIGFWEKSIKLSLIGSIFASIGGGIALAWLTPNPLDILRSISGRVWHSLGDLPFAFGIVIGFAVGLAISIVVATCKTLCRRNSQHKDYDGDAEYDPASPEVLSQKRRGWLV